MKLNSQAKLQAFDERLQLLENALEGFSSFSLSALSAVSTNNSDKHSVLKELFQKTQGKGKQNEINWNQMKEMIEREQNTENENISQTEKMIKENFKQIQIKIDQQYYKFDDLQQSFNKINEKLDSKASKDQMKVIAEQARNMISDMSGNVKQLADKDSVNYLLRKVESVDNVIKTLLTIDNFKKLNEERLNEFKETLFYKIDSDYQQKADYQRDINSVNKRIDEVNPKLSQLREDQLKYLQKSSEQYGFLKGLIDTKASMSSFNDFEQYAKGYVHEQQIRHIYEQLLPITKECKQDTIKCKNKILEFENFVNKIDETLMYKSEKLELIQLKDYMEQTYVTKQFHNNKDIQTTCYIQQESSCLKAQIDKQNQVKIDKLALALLPLMLAELEKAVLKFDLEQKRQLQVVEGIQLDLQKKAEISHIIILDRQKADQEVVNKMKIDNNEQKKNFETLITNLLSFMDKFVSNNDFMSPHSNKRDIKDAIDNILSIIETSTYKSFLKSKVKISQNDSDIYFPFSSNVFKKDLSPDELFNSKQVETLVSNSTPIHKMRPQTTSNINSSTKNENSQPLPFSMDHSRSVTPTSQRSYNKGNNKKGRPLRPLLSINSEGVEMLNQKNLMQTSLIKSVSEYKKLKIFTDSSSKIANLNLDKSDEQRKIDISDTKTEISENKAKNNHTNNSNNNNLNDNSNSNNSNSNHNIKSNNNNNNNNNSSSSSNNKSNNNNNINTNNNNNHHNISSSKVNQKEEQIDNLFGEWQSTEEDNMMMLRTPTNSIKGRKTDSQKRMKGVQKGYVFSTTPNKIRHDSPFSMIRQSKQTKEQSLALQVIQGQKYLLVNNASNISAEKCEEKKRNKSETKN